VAQTVGRGIALHFHDRGTRRSAARPDRNLPPGKTRYPFYRRLGGPQGRSGRAENLVPTGIGVHIKRHEACFGSVHMDIACASRATVVRYQR